jgi:DNA-directed RNA polymerase specialized sigma24 family protein
MRRFLCTRCQRGDASDSAVSQEEDARLGQLYQAIRELPKLDASLALMLLDGLSYRAMSEVLGISENHVGGAAASHPETTDGPIERTDR